MDQGQRVAGPEAGALEEVRVDLFDLVHRQLLIARDAAETGLLLLQVARQGRVGSPEGTEALEAVLKDNAPPATFGGNRKE